MRKIAVLTILLLLAGCAAVHAQAMKLKSPMSDVELLNGYYEIGNLIDKEQSFIAQCRAQGRYDMAERMEKKLKESQQIKSLFILELRRRGIQPEIAGEKIRERPRGEAPGVPEPGAKPKAKDGADCLEYEPATVKLAGKVLREVCPGPPNFESVEKGDEKRVVWFLNLEKPVCVKGEENDSTNIPVSNIRKVQLVLGSTQYKTYKTMVNKNVMVTGQLFHSFTGHHYAEVLLIVKTMTANNPPESHGLPIPTPEGLGENIK